MNELNTTSQIQEGNTAQNLPVHTHNGVDSALIDKTSNDIPGIPVTIAQGGTGSTTQSTALTAILGSSFIPIANGGTALTVGPTETIILTAGGGLSPLTSGATPAQQIEFGTNKQNIYVVDFDASSVEYYQWLIKMPARWDGGAILYSVDWLADSSSTNQVMWALQGRAYADGDTIDQAWGTAAQNIDSNTGQNKLNQDTNFVSVTLGGSPAAAQAAIIRLYRDAADVADSLAVDARMVQVRIKYGTTGYTD